MISDHIEKIKTQPGQFLRDIVFGANDGVVTAVGFLVGFAGAVADQQLIIIAGFLEIIAGAASMALGNYLGVKSQKEFQLSREEQADHFNPIISGVLMGIAYLAGGIPPLLPFLLFKPITRALILSILVSIVVMALIGVFRWILHREKLGKKISETVSIGLIAAGIGFLAGEILKLMGYSV